MSERQERSWEWKYILDGQTPVPCHDPIAWARWYESHPNAKIIAQDTVGNYWISTVFLFINHNWGSGPPILFETMIFPEEGHQRGVLAELWQERYATWEEAAQRHAFLKEQLARGWDPEGDDEPDLPEPVTPRSKKLT